MSKELIKQYLQEKKVMQLATSENGNSWVCSVYFVNDSDLNLYWLSLPDRRHSKEIKQNPKVAITVVIKENLPVIGLQSEGTAETVDDVIVIENIMSFYINKYDEGKSFLKNYKNGTNNHILYKFKPTSYILFDEYNFTGTESQEVIKL